MDKQAKIKRAMHDEITRLRAELDATNARAQEAALQALAAQGQAAEAHDARLKAEAERDAALSVIRAMLDADEHGQGIAWQDAMDRAHAMIQTPS